MKNTLVAMIKFEVEGGGGGGGDGGNKPPLSPIGFIDTSKCDEIGKSIKITPVSSFKKKSQYEIKPHWRESLKLRSYN